MADADSTTGTDDLANLDGIGDSYAEELRSAGVDSVADLAEADPSELSEEIAVGEGRLSEFVDRARETANGDSDSPDDAADGSESDGGAGTGAAENDDAADSDAPATDVDEPVQLHEVRDVVEDLASELIRHPLDGVVEIEPGDEEGQWHADVEVIERSAVPDTQDILGRYALTVGPDGSVQRYERLRRYRRGDVGE